MIIFLESPWPWLIIGITVEVALVIALLITRRGNLLWAMLGTAVFTLLGLGVERLVVTDREAVRQTLDAGVAAARANSLERLLDCISPRAKLPQDYARTVLGRVQIEEAHIHDVEITVNRQVTPPTAVSRFLAVGKGQDRQGEIPYKAFAQRVIVNLHLEGARWLVTDFDVEEIEGGSRNRLQPARRPPL
jgi:hypothetical protein